MYSQIYVLLSKRKKAFVLDYYCINLMVAAFSAVCSPVELHVMVCNMGLFKAYLFGWLYCLAEVFQFKIVKLYLTSWLWDWHYIFFGLVLSFLTILYAKQCLCWKLLEYFQCAEKYPENGKVFFIVLSNKNPTFCY